MTLAAAANVMARDPAALQLRLLQTVVEVAAERNSTLVMPVPVELLRFFDKFTPTTPSAEGQGASMADFGGEDLNKEEKEIESGAPLEIPDVPSIPELPQADAGLDKVPAQPDDATVVTGDGRHDDTTVVDTSAKHARDPRA